MIKTILFYCKENEYIEYLKLVDTNGQCWNGKIIKSNEKEITLQITNVLDKKRIFTLTEDNIDSIKLKNIISKYILKAKFKKCSRRVKYE